MIEENKIEEVKQEEKIDPVENLKQVQQELDKFKADPANRKKAIELANQIQFILGTKKDKWFSLKQLSKRVKENEVQLYSSLKVLQLFNLCTAKSWDSSKHFHRGELVFRIHISIESELIMVDEMIASLSDELQSLQHKKNALMGQLVIDKAVQGDTTEPVA